jgi:hypothetical protein
LPFNPTSQFGDIYQEDYFVKYMKNDVRIVKELPARLRSLDLEAIGSQVGAAPCCLCLFNTSCFTDSGFPLPASDH